jgi:hypothetical protein
VCRPQKPQAACLLSAPETLSPCFSLLPATCGHAVPVSLWQTLNSCSLLCHAAVQPLRARLLASMHHCCCCFSICVCLQVEQPIVTGLVSRPWPMCDPFSSPCLAPFNVSIRVPLLVAAARLGTASLSCIPCGTVLPRRTHV